MPRDATAKLEKLEFGETIKMSNKPNLRAVPLSDGATAATANANHGGARENAGRKPKALRFAAELATAEGQIIQAMPEVIGGLIEAAKGGDVAAARYLLDRVFGRVSESPAPMAEDNRLPPDEEAFDLAQAERNAMNDLRRNLT